MYFFKKKKRQYFKTVSQKPLSFMSADKTSSGVTGFGLEEMQATCWSPQHGLYWSRETLTCGSSDAALVCRVSNPAMHCYKDASLQLEKKNQSHSIGIANDVSVRIEIKIRCQLPSEATGIFTLLNVKGMSVPVLPWILCEHGKCQQFCCRRWNEEGWLLQPPSAQQTSCSTAKIFHSTEMSKMSVGFVARYYNIK